MRRKYKEIWYKIALKTTQSRSAEVRTHGWCHSLGNHTVEVTKPNKKWVTETQILLKVPPKMPVCAEKYAICAKNFAEMCDKNVAICEICCYRTFP